MPLVPRDRLVAACREADAATVTDFVADLYAARGYTVDRPGEGLLTLDPGGRTVAVRPDGGPVPTSADVVVTVDGGTVPSHRGDLEIVDAGTLHEQLHYAVDRDVARDLLATHFDLAVDERPLEQGDNVDRSTAGAHDPAGGGDRSDAASGFLPWRADRRQVALAAVASVVLLAALAIGGVAELSPAEGPETDGPSAVSTPGPTPTATPEPMADASASTSRTATPLEGERRGDRSLPPGVGPDGIEDVDRMVAAHQSGLSNTSFTVNIWYREFVDGRLTGVYVETIRVENERRYRTDLSTAGTLVTTPRAVAGGELYVDGDRRHVGRSTDGPYFRNMATPSRFRRQIGQYLSWSLSVKSSTLQDRRSVGNRTTYRLTTDGDPYPGVENASGTVYVTADGVVTYGRWSYTLPEDSDRRIEFAVRTSKVGSTTVARPAWVDDENEE